METLIDLINVVIWPAVVLFLIMWSRKPLRELLPYLEKFKYKEMELIFRNQLDHVMEEVGEDALAEDTGSAEPEQLSELIELSPNALILESWRKLENAAMNKITHLIKENKKRERAISRPIDYLEYTGALIPSDVRAIREIRNLRNQVAHAGAPISKEVAIDYAKVANVMAKKIELITDLPIIKLKALTLLILELNHLIDTGEFNDISIDDVYREIERKNILPFLKEATKGRSDFSLYSEDGPYAGFSDFYHERMERIHSAYAGDHRRRWGVENLGLCLVLAWTNQLVQQGTGWYPMED